LTPTDTSSRVPMRQQQKPLPRCSDDAGCNRVAVSDLLPQAVSLTV
jgi:hypothetical protein